PMPTTPFPTFVAIGALLLCATRLAAQDPTPTPAAVQPGPHGLTLVTDPPADCLDAWHRFTDRHPGAFRAHWNLATGTPSAVYGEGMAIADWRGSSLEEARRHAAAVLEQESELLRLGRSDFRETIGARMGRTWSFTFDQYFAGLPVIGGRADVRVSMAGRIAMLGSVAFEIPNDFSTTPAVGAEAATFTAWQNLGEPPTANPQAAPSPAPRLVIWGDTAARQRTAPRLCWEVAISNIAADGSGKIGRSYVDAQTGGVLRHENDKHQCGAGCAHDSHRRPNGETATAAAVPPASAPIPVNTSFTFRSYTRVGLSATSTPVLMPMVGLEVNVVGVGTFTTNQAGVITVNINAPTQLQISGFNGIHHRTITGSSAPSALHPGIPGMNQSFTLVPSGATSAQLAHSNCAYWIHLVNEWARGIFGNSPQLNGLDDLGVVVNINSSCNAYYSSGNNSVNFYAAGGGCQNSAFSTVIAHEWGHGLDNSYGGISNTATDGLSEGWADTVAMYLVDDPNVGEGFSGSGATRNGNNAVAYGTQTTEHGSGQSWMGFAWRFRDLLDNTLTRAQAKAISNEVFLGSIVADATDQLAATLEVFLADDDDGILNNGTPHYAELQLAAAIHALPVPMITPLVNDYCAGAITIGNGVHGPFNNTGATGISSSWVCLAGVADNDLWFRYVAPTAGQLTVSTCGLTSLNTKIQFRAGSCSGTVLACNDNSCGMQSTCTGNVPAGTIYIQVGALSYGTFRMQVWGPGSASGVPHGTGCGPVPLALAGTAPRLGTNLVLTTTGMNPTAPIGLQQLGNVGYQNGVNLGPIGMAGCYQWSENLVMHTIVGTGTTATYSLPIPNDTALLDYPLTAQSVALAPGYNSFGLVTSNGWWMKLGN
nr:hypothetical protein [Planctomycetota bacterium]